MQFELRKKIVADKIKDGMEYLHNQLLDIKQAITFARTGTLSSHLLEMEELENISLIHYENIKTGLIHDTEKNLLFFTIQVPIMSKELCHKLLVVPIPNYINNTEVILDTNLNYIVCDGNVCTNDGIEIKNMKRMKDKCLQELYNFEPAKCKYQENDTKRR